MDMHPLIILSDGSSIATYFVDEHPGRNITGEIRSIKKRVAILVMS
jgi:hypothetical protein